MPPDYEVFEFEDCARLINSDDDLTEQDERCTDLISKLPSLISEWSDQRMCTLISMLPVEKSPGSVDTEENTTSNINRLKLATSTFRCASAGCHNSTSVASWMPLIALDDILPHACTTSSWVHQPPNFYAQFSLERQQTKLEFHPFASAAVTSLVNYLGLDSNKVFATDLDHLDARFLCLNCNPKFYGSLYGQKAMTWRGCVSMTQRMNFLFSLLNNFFPHSGSSLL